VYSAHSINNAISVVIKQTTRNLKLFQIVRYNTYATIFIQP